MGPPSTSPPQGARRAPLAGMSSHCREDALDACRANPQPTPQITTTTQPNHTSSNSHPLAHNVHPTQVLHHEPPSRPQSPPQPQHTSPAYAPAPPTDPTLPWHTPITPIPTAFSFSHSPWMEMDAFVLTPEGCLLDHLHQPPPVHRPYPTVKTLPIRQKTLVSQAINLTMEEVVRSEGLANNRWLAILHLIPRLLLPSSIALYTHARRHQTPPYNMSNRPPANPPRSSSFRNPIGGRRVRPPRDISGDAFEARVRAFLQGRFWELLAPSMENGCHFGPYSATGAPRDTP